MRLCKDGHATIRGTDSARLAHKALANYQEPANKCGKFLQIVHELPSRSLEDECEELFDWLISNQSLERYPLCHDQSGV